MTDINKQIDHEFTMNVVCPYCGYEDRDSWELSENDGETNCGRCDEEFSYTRNITVDYSTFKID